ncbi:MAG: TonB-denpendent receptor [Chitinophagaceae bacterium]|nr:TonB-denpendent receptor [Chitinophagaceae bacterium]
MKNLYQLLTLTGFSLFTLTAQAQTERVGQITGNITGVQKPVESASITLLKAKDSSVVKLAISDKGGNFSLEKLSFGKYLLAIQAVGFQKKLTESFELTQSHPVHKILPVVLEPGANKLQGVTVSSKKPFIEQKAGKIIVNVEASPTSGGMSALEMLEKAPGVAVDKDGNISLKGKQGVMIMIDGKPTYLSSADLSNMLKNMPGSALDQIEVMTNPPAKYDAAGNSGIINIKTKKNIIKGMNGSFNTGYTQGLYGRTNSSLNLNYRNNKLNVFGGYNFNYNQGFNNLTISRRFLEADKKTINSTADQVSRPHSIGYNHSFKAGADYYFSKKDVAGIVVNGFFNNRTEDPESNSYVRNANGGIIYQLRSHAMNAGHIQNGSVNMNYKHTFDSTGKEITADLDYVMYNRANNTSLSTQAYDGTGNKTGNVIVLNGVMPAAIDIYTAKTDYVHPLGKTAKLEAGVKSSYVTNNNRVDYTRNSGSGWKPDGRSNHFIYNETINAAYVSLNKSWKKISMDAGLRLENTISKGHQLSNDSSFKRNYTNLFPNIGLSFEANKNNQFSLSYTRRVDRPSYDDLNPFTYFLDSLTYGQGNPYLQPQFTHNIEVSHTFHRALVTTLNYSRTTDVITQLLKQDTQKKVTYQTQDNVSEMQQIGLTIMYNAPLKKWWNTNLYLNIYNNHYQGIYQADPIDIQFTTFSANMNNTFSLPKGWTIELSGFYRGKGAEGLLVAKEMYAVNSGVSKQVLKKKGTVKLGIRDIFFTQKFSGYARYSDVDVQVASDRDSRQVNLSFNYRFGKTNIAPARRRTGGAGDEQNRVKVGN